MTKTPNVSQTQPDRAGLVLFGLMVCTASGVVAGILGALAGLLYIPWRPAIFPPPLQVRIPPYFLGASSGLIAGLLWCGIMLPRAMNRKPGDRIVLRGIIWGVVVAIFSTAFLHTGLKLTAPLEMPSAWIAGLIFGVPAGIVLGWVSGAILSTITGPRQNHLGR